MGISLCLPIYPASYMEPSSRSFFWDPLLSRTIYLSVGLETSPGGIASWFEELRPLYLLLPAHLLELFSRFSVSACTGSQHQLLYHPFLVKNLAGSTPTPEKTSPAKDWGLCNNYGHDTWAGIPDCHIFIHWGSWSLPKREEEGRNLAPLLRFLLSCFSPQSRPIVLISPLE